MLDDDDLNDNDDIAREDAQSPSFNEYQNEMMYSENCRDSAGSSHLQNIHTLRGKHQLHDEMSPSSSGKYPTTQMTTEYNEMDYAGGVGETDDRYRAGANTIYSMAN
mmetsp:Transcript_20186/g.27282  ORF Transcript_20186/g.27282 Transcript_20186/m.27282 type:complete len:107 (+) Transcript_20186:331-651(+)